MARKNQPKRIEDIYQAIEENPGQRPGFIADRLELPRSSVTRVLPALDDQGYLISEDERGGLWPFRRKH